MVMTTDGDCSSSSSSCCRVVVQRTTPTEVEALIRVRLTDMQDRLQNCRTVLEQQVGAPGNRQTDTHHHVSSTGGRPTYYLPARARETGRTLVGSNRHDDERELTSGPAWCCRWRC